MRLDNYLVMHSFAQSRNKAQSIIKEGLVHVDEKCIKKPSFEVKEGMCVIVQEHKSYVSRAAYKLLYFLEDTQFNVNGKVALDIGSSTGGFTQVLLERGAKEVYAVDVGTQQLHVSLRSHPQVHLFENTDIREFQTKKKFGLVVSDVAFISLLYILDAVDVLAQKDIVLLFKPQFEVGRDAKRDKNGVVQDEKAVAEAMVRFENRCQTLGWELKEKLPAKIAGKEGNVEWCYHFEKKEEV